METSLYLGSVSHTRFTPFRHHFKYPLFMVLLDLDELPGCFDGLPGWSVNKLGLAQFRRSDYLGDSKKPLDLSVRELVKERCGVDVRGPIKLLTHLRYFWHNFNPVSFYYCYAEDGETLEAIVAEVSNTPWREKATYVLTGSDMNQDITANKIFHVSPFMPMDMQYRFRFSKPGSMLHVHISAERDNESMFSADMCLEHKSLTRISGTKTLIRYPAMTLQVLAKIYWQALKLKMRGAKFYEHPAAKGY